MGIRLEGDLRRLRKTLKNLETIEFKQSIKEIGMTLKESTRERFGKEETPEGSKWRTSVRAQSEGGVTLSDTGLLKNSIRYKAKNGGVAVGTDVIYAKTHQDGFSGVIKAKTSKGLRFRIGNRWINKRSVKVNIPARPFIGISEDDMVEIKTIIMDALGRCTK